jgi:hypothetical protein
MTDFTVKGVQELVLDLKKLPEALKKNVVLRISQVAYDEGQKGAGRHVETGALFQSLFNRQIGDGRTVGHDRNRAPHAPFVIQGTDPHDIFPNTKKALRWASGGQFFFSKKVRHPGYEGDPYMDNASDRAMSQFSGIVDTVLKEAL